MKLAIISDIHANMEALTACFKKIDELKADKIICLGDIVDYCAEPNECISLIQKHCDSVVIGNHDEAQIRHELSDGFSNDAKISSIHTRSLINPGYIEYFKTLPYTYSFNNLLFVHASPETPQNYRYIQNMEAALRNFNSFNEEICFIGHSHKPVIFRERVHPVNETDKDTETVTDEDVESGARYIINVGSVGQPRDGDARLSFGLYDTGLWKYSNIRVEYDAKIASNKIKSEGLPQTLADRILIGV